MLSFLLFSLGVTGSALAWPSHPRHALTARNIQSRKATPPATPKAPVAATWFASWHAQDFPLSNLSWNKYTTVTYSFAVTTPNVSFVNISDPDVFKDFVDMAHSNNCSASISVGGWSGSQYFSTAVATAQNRTKFVNTMVNLVKDNNLDGLDFDWEYPGRAGIGCNSLSAKDTGNFLAFLTELRAALPNTTLSAATAITPFMSPDLTTPSTNVSGFANVLDYIAIMNYDIWGPWSDTVGPNAPLNDTCAANATQRVGSAVSAVEAWTKAGIPADQIVLGVAAYGHGFSVAETNGLTSDGSLALYAPFNKSLIPHGDAWDDANGTVDACGTLQTQGGTWDFWGLIDGGFLNENGTANMAEGIAYKFDECSQTPFVYNKTSGIMVGYDDAVSFAAKGRFINSIGLRGFAMWEAGGDYDDILLDSIRAAVGFPAIPDDDNCEEGPTPSAITSGSATPSPTSSYAPKKGVNTPSGSTPKGSSNGGKNIPGVAAAIVPPTQSSSPAKPAYNPTPVPNPKDDGDKCEDEDPEPTSISITSPAPTSTKTSAAPRPTPNTSAAAKTTNDDECNDEDPGSTPVPKASNSSSTPDDECNDE